MKKSIVVFGPTHSGKSTLVGYCITRHYSDDEFYREEQKRKKRVNAVNEKGYNPDKRFSYFVDETTDEMRNVDTGRGTSKMDHYKAYPFEGNEFSFLFIDSPGSDQNWKNKYRAMFLGDIGLCVINIEDVVALSRKANMLSESNKALYDRVFGPLLYWDIHKGAENLIIILSQYDRINFSHFAYMRCAELIRSNSIFQDVEIIPTSIDIHNRLDHNVQERSKKTEWYQGKTLSEAINAKQIDDASPRNETLLVTVVKKMVTSSTKESVLRTKVLTGVVSTRQKITLGPVRKKGDNSPIFVTGTVKSLKIEDLPNTIEEMYRGDIGGIIPSLAGRLNLSDLSMKRTTIVCDAETPLSTGNIVYLSIETSSIEHEKNEVLENIKANDRLVLVWFGNKISMVVVGYIFETGKCTLALVKREIDDSLFCQPLGDDNKIIYDQFVLIIKGRLFRAFLFGMGEIYRTKPYELTLFTKLRKPLHELQFGDQWKDVQDQEGETIITVKGLYGERFIRCVTEFGRFLRKNEDQIETYTLTCSPANEMIS